MIKTKILTLIVKLSREIHITGDGLLKLEMLNGNTMIRGEDSKFPNCAKIHQKEKNPK